MNYLNSAHTGKAARTLEAAFGIESATAHIEPMPTHRTPAQEAGELVLIVLGLVLIVGTPIYCYLT